MKRLRVVQLGLTVALLAVSTVVLLVRPPLAAGGATIPEWVSTPPAAPAAESLAKGDVSRIVSGNLFAQTRAAPRTRYMPDAPFAGGDSPGVPLPSSAADGPREPILIGTIAGPDGGSALVRFPGAIEPRLLRVGERFNEWRLTRVDALSATLEGPRGTRSLPLRAPPPA